MSFLVSNVFGADGWNPLFESLFIPQASAAKPVTWTSYGKDIMMIKKVRISDMNCNG